MKNKKLLAFLLCMLFPLVSAAASFQEGVQYIEFPFAPRPAGNKVEVREFFWYGCPHCFALEPYLEKWLKHKPADVEFIRTPGVSPQWMNHAKAYYAFKAMGIADKITWPLFQAIHVQNRPLNDEDSLAAFVAQQGYSAKKFREAFQSFGVRVEVDRAQQLAQQYGIDAVPSLVIDGRYGTSPAMAGGDPQVIAVMDYLIKKAQAQRAGKVHPR